MKREPNFAFVYPVGLEEGPDGATLVHAFTVPGCVAGGDTREEALAVFPEVLANWLNALSGFGEAVPPAEQELEISVDEWVREDADVAAGESRVCFQADMAPVSQPEVMQALRRLGDLRGTLLSRIRRLREPDFDRFRLGDWTLRQILDELARAQWWTLSRLGASPMAEVPARLLGRLDTAMVLVVQQFTELGAEERSRVLELEGELWTPRKVLRRLLWLEWSLGRAALAALSQEIEP